jgi:lysine/ornithine N-monooxygenase
VDGRDAQDYQTPTNDLFCDHCSNIVSNYTLSTSVSQSQVVSIEYATNGSSIFPDTAYFTLNTSKGPTFARIVVLAIGPGSSPLLPRPISLQESEGACHSSVLPQRGCPAPHVRERIVQKKITNVVVVGGGLTSAQISDLCIRKGVTRVWHLMRGAYKVKHFDVDLPWVSKYRNLEMAAFWSADSDEERFEKIRTARGGGSITPLFKKIEAKHVSNGRLRIHTNTEIVRQDWDSDKKTWHIETEPSIDDLPSIDHIYYATGAKADIQEVEMLENIRAQWPIRDVGGLPCLTHDLQWHEDLPLFVSGRFAGLRIGPGAPNLEGARIGAERIAWRIQELMERDLRQERAAGGDAGADILVKAQQGSCWRSTHAENLRASNMFSPLELVVS